MTKRERELEHDRQTLMMMANVNKHAAVQEIVRENRNTSDSNQIGYYIVAFCAGCLTTIALAMLSQFI